MKLKDKLMLEKIKLKNLQPDLSRNRGRKLRSIKLEMKKGRLQWIPQKYKVSQETTQTAICQ